MSSINKYEKLSKEFLLWLFKYDDLKGKLYWRNHWNPAAKSKFLGREVGVVNIQGYRALSINGKTHVAHKLIWLLETGESDTMIDHIDGNKDNNRISNLRRTTQRRNANNRKIHRNGKLVGASFKKDIQLWECRIRLNGVKRSLGYFNTEHEAHLRYLAELQNKNL